MLTFKSLELVTIEDFLEGKHDNIDLNIVKSVSGELVLVLEIGGVFQQNVRKRDKVHHKGERYHDRA